MKRSCSTFLKVVHKLICSWVRNIPESAWNTTHIRQSNDADNFFSAAPSCHNSRQTRKKDMRKQRFAFVYAQLRVFPWVLAIGINSFFDQGFTAAPSVLSWEHPAPHRKQRLTALSTMGAATFRSKTPLFRFLSGQPERISRRFPGKRELVIHFDSEIPWIVSGSRVVSGGNVLSLIKKKWNSIVVLLTNVGN